MSDAKASFILRNPESFAGAFISVVSNTLADQIAQRIRFTPSGSVADHDLDTLFPPEKQFIQRELMDAGPKALYDQIQTDSDNERTFVRLLEDGDTNLVFYFKFPAGFKVPLPRQIGNYNPDWGLGRIDESGVTLLYIRETKGSEDLQQLQWAHEKRKIVCAQKYFLAIGLDYRPVTGSNSHWWQPMPLEQTLHI